MDERAKEAIKYGAVLLLLVLFFFGGTYALRGIMGTKYPVMVVVSQSMVPSLGVGDFIVVGETPNPDEIDVGPPPDGDILVFVRNSYSDEYIVHRAIEKRLEDGVWVYVTKGDNNRFPDPIPIRENQVVGKVKGRLPILGYFSLFIKTMRGFGLVALFMIISFFLDYVLPPKKQEGEEGSFPLLSITPYIITILAVLSLWFIQDNNLVLEVVAVIAWYVGCFLIPLSFWDDDMGLMLWLYHLVLIMIPISCDIVWWTTDITPSMWWSVQGSTLPITWLLMEETRFFHQSYIIILTIIVPGSLIFLATILAKRHEIGPFHEFSKKLRGISSDYSFEAETYA